ncbi:hypothetical protein [Kaarinaea lacus]
MRKYALLSVLISLLLGCGATTPYLPGPTAHTVVKPGSVLKLTKAVTIFPPEAGVRFQNGKIVEKNFDQWRPNCRLETRDPVTSNQDIRPDEFTIIQVGIEYQFVQSEPVKLAALGISLGGGGASATAERMRTNFFLQSKKQPQVTRLLCQHWENPEDSRHLMLSEIEQTLGDYFIFQLK